MYLKQLEIQGFKSFPEKIRLKFGSGITAVVGPNGSGKSNVADAIRWVLGEAGPKNLRGQKMEDVIFSGTQNRKQLSFAEVSLILDNNDMVLKTETPEVIVTRRLYRSGESAYLINSVPCRRKDILELFMDTGVGKEGYSIIGQGRIDEILSIKSEDRRMLFEEAAGIVKYKNRRSEAQKKLDNERANLLRANDIISELEGRLDPLKKAAAKAKKYIVLAEKLKLTDVNIFVQEAGRFEEQSEKLKAETEGLVEDIHQAENTLAEAEKSRSEKKAKGDKLNDDIEALNKQITDLKLKYSEKLNEISLLNNEIAHMEQEIIKIGSDREFAEKSAEEKKNSINAKETAIALKIKLYENMKNKTSKALAEYDALKAELSAKENIISEYNKSIMDKLSEATVKREEIAGVKERIEGVNERLKLTENEIAINEGLLNEKNILITTLEKDAKTAAAKLKKLDEEYDSLSENKSSSEKEIDSLDIKLSDITSDINKINAEINALTGLEERFEGYYQGVRSVLKNKASLKGICGAVGQLIKTEKKYELAVETALGGSLQSIITDNEEAAKNAVEFLKRTRGGRATFLPLTANRTEPRPLSNDITSARGYIGTAAELISFDNKYAPIINSLLARTAVTDNIESGIALAKKCHYSVKIVTLTGEVFNIGGSITGGSASVKNAGILSRKSRLEDLKAEIGIKLKSRNEINLSLSEAKKKLAEHDKDISDNRRSFSEENIALTSLMTKIKAEKDLSANIKETIQKHDREITDLKIRKDNFMSSLSTLTMTLAGNEDAINDLNEKLSFSETENRDSKAILDEKNNVLTNLQLESERMFAEINSEEREKERLKAEIEELMAGCSDNIETANKLKADIENSKRLIADKQNETYEINSQTEKLSDDHGNKLKERYELNNLLSEIDSTIKEHNDTLLLLNNKKTSNEEKLASLKEKSRSLYDSMWENYEITYPAALKMEKLDLSLSKLHQQSKELKAEIKALGSINTQAPEEYAETKERYEFLISQKADIEKAEADLTEIIDKLEQLMRDKFAEGFKTINENFKVVFKEMFGGGNAYIKLADEDDVLNSGIEINAQPPGKKLQSMLLLSGGERALTAMALLFAILKMKPSPFCILDEIEAALDDANVTRYARYIKRLSNTTQFVLITHRKGTMEEADALYGITMQEQGISKMVSVSLKEADEYSE